uniref:Uncharacterized protein n=1 Tax=Astyanax mexicanus TaxID=7994 RepID=A0A3B1K399_ASTMX
MAKSTDAETQTVPNGTTEDKETQTSNPCIMRIDLERTPTRLRHSLVKETDGMPTALFQFDRQAPARISTSPTLRRMRSTRLPSREMGKMDSTQEESGAWETSSPRSPLSPVYRQKSPLAVIPAQSNGEGDQDGHSDRTVPHGKIRSLRSKTIDSSVGYKVMFDQSLCNCIVLLTCATFCHHGFLSSHGSGFVIV